MKAEDSPWDAVLMGSVASTVSANIRCMYPIWCKTGAIFKFPFFENSVEVHSYFDSHSHFDSLDEQLLQQPFFELLGFGYLGA